jgi:cytoskeletal protein CcmA (bactofilin family)
MFADNAAYLRGNPPKGVPARGIWSILYDHAISVLSKTHAERNMAIFKKSDDEEVTNLASPPRIGEALPVRPTNVSVIGPTLVFKGDLVADEDLVIEGRIEGTIAHHKKHLTVGKQGRVIADIHASSVIIEGQLVGDIHGDEVVSLASSADVTGNIFCSRIVIEDGARFKGKIEMGEGPKVSLVPKQPERGKPVRTEKPDTVAG